MQAQAAMQQQQQQQHWHGSRPGNGDAGARVQELQAQVAMLASNLQQRDREVAALKAKERAGNGAAAPAVQRSALHALEKQVRRAVGPEEGAQTKHCGCTGPSVKQRRITAPNSGDGQGMCFISLHLPLLCTQSRWSSCANS